MSNTLKSEARQLWLAELSLDEIKNTLNDRFPSQETEVDKILNNYSERKLFMQNLGKIGTLVALIIFILLINLILMPLLTIGLYLIHQILGIIVGIIMLLIFALYVYILINITRGKLSGYSILSAVTIFNMISSLNNMKSIGSIVGIGINILIITLCNNLSKTLKTGNTTPEGFSTISEHEIEIKKYIEQNKTQYSKESIKSALTNAGNNSDEIEKYINKYY